MLDDIVNEVRTRLVELEEAREEVRKLKKYSFISGVIAAAALIAALILAIS